MNKGKNVVYITRKVMQGIAGLGGNHLYVGFIETT